MLKGTAKQVDVVESVLRIALEPRNESNGAIFLLTLQRERFYG